MLRPEPNVKRLEEQRQNPQPQNNLRPRVIAEDQRRDFFLYVDEFQNFVTGSFAAILSEARKYRLSLTLAHQYLGQLRDWRHGPDRTEQAEMMIRETMYRRTIGRITHAEESRVFSILAFAMPSNAFVES